MGMEALTTARWLTRFSYREFERIALGSVLVMLAVITVYAIAFTAIKLVGDLALGESFLDKAALQDTFGLILTTLDVETLLGFGGLLLALGGPYWLISDGDRRRAQAAGPAGPES